MAPTPEEEVRSLAFKLTLVLRQSYVAYLAVLVNSLFYVFLTWHEAFRPKIVLWAATLNFFTLFRFFMAEWMRRRPTTRLALLKRRHFLFFAGSLTSGVLWGIIGWFYFESNSSLTQSFSLFLLTGMTAGAVGVYSASPPIFFAYLVPALLPFAILSLMAPDTPHFVMGIVCLLYLAMMINVGLTAHKATLEAIGLRAQNDALEAEQRAASRLLANVSHEIRTPIAAINGYIDLLHSDLNRGTDETEALSIMKKSSEHLLSVVDDLLDLSQLHAGKVQLNHKWFSLMNEVESVLNLSRPRNRNEITIQVDAAASTPDRIYSDPKVFRQILINLLTNALKFTPSGHIGISVRPDDRDGCKKIVITVSDTGIGMESSLLPGLFQPFSRGKNFYVQDKHGSGLGLALSKELAHLLGGDLVLEKTQLGRGSTFSFWIAADLDRVLNVRPEEITAHPKKAKIEKLTDTVSGLSILVVDDAPELRSLMARILERKGIRVTVSSTGLEAVARAREKTYDLILMDLSMPVLDGYEATTQIRQAGYDKPIVALTAHISEEHRKRCFATGFDDFLVKPVNQEDLLKTVAHWGHRRHLTEQKQQEL